MEYSYSNYEIVLIKRMMKLSEDKETQMILLQRSFYNSIKYSFISLSLLSATPHLLILAKSSIHETLV
jgi:hypothetical protein